MKLFWEILVILYIALNQISAHSTQSLDKENSHLLDQYSLADILSLKEIPEGNWVIDGYTQLKDGRIVLTPNENSHGSLWLKTVPINDVESFTLQWTFRSINYIGPTNGGISFWILMNPGNEKVKGVETDSWPKRFNGLQILIDNTGPYGESIRALLSDMTKSIDLAVVDQHFFAQCLVGYQDVSVPTTLRLSYNNENKLLKLQINNKICFQTQKIKLWDDNKDYNNNNNNNNRLRIGVTANNYGVDGRFNNESFEILQMKLYNGLTSETFIPNVKQMPQPQILQKNIKTNEITVKDPMKSLYSDVNNYRLFKKLDHIEGKIIANDISDLIDKLDDIIRIQNSIIEYLLYLMKKYFNYSDEMSTLGEHNYNNFENLILMDDKLQQLLDEQQKIRELTLKHHTSMGINSNHADYIVTRLLQLWLIPLIVIMLIMGYYTFKIKQDIANTKLL
ncbi:uncharacterized protein PWA37_000038 [Arxiozyma heterogenica]|uniref:uncharacterized protein n=1 Tax=Arxiozyma heterogenica TaxID=278026 RepID=UPI002F0C8E32